VPISVDKKYSNEIRLRVNRVCDGGEISMFFRFASLVDTHGDNVSEENTALKMEKGFVCEKLVSKYESVRRRNPQQKYRQI
jgi:hypothetical protein